MIIQHQNSNSDVLFRFREILQFLTVHPNCSDIEVERLYYLCICVAKQKTLINCAVTMQPTCGPAPLFSHIQKTTGFMMRLLKSMSFFQVIFFLCVSPKTFKNTNTCNRKYMFNASILNDLTL